MFAIKVMPVLALAEISALVPEWPANLRDESGNFKTFVLQDFGVCCSSCHSSLHSAQGRICHSYY